MFPLPSAQICEAGLPSKARIQGFWDSAALVINGIGVDAVFALSPQCGPEEPASILGCCTGAFYYTEGPERPGYGSRMRTRTRLTGGDFMDLRACIHHHTTD